MMTKESQSRIVGATASHKISNMTARTAPGGKRDTKKMPLSSTRWEEVKTARGQGEGLHRNDSTGILH